MFGLCLCLWCLTGLQASVEAWVTEWKWKVSIMLGSRFEAVVDLCDHGGSVGWRIPFDVEKECQGIVQMRVTTSLVINAMMHNFKVSLVTVYRVFFLHMGRQVTFTAKHIIITFSA